MWSTGDDRTGAWDVKGGRSALRTGRFPFRYFSYVKRTPASDQAARRSVVRVYRLGEEPGDDLRNVTTVAERLAMVAELSRRMWELTGRPTPQYGRSELPVRVVRQQ